MRAEAAFGGWFTPTNWLKCQYQTKSFPLSILEWKTNVKNKPPKNPHMARLHNRATQQTQKSMQQLLILSNRVQCDISKHHAQLHATWRKSMRVYMYMLYNVDSTWMLLGSSLYSVYMQYVIHNCILYKQCLSTILKVKQLEGWAAVRELDLVY